MKTYDPSRGSWRTRLAWLAAFVGASLIFSLGLGCEVPLVAFAAICGLRQSRREALLFVSVVWLTDELVGFTAWHYPVGFAGFGWAAAVGAAILAATWAAGAVARRIAPALGSVSAFISAFAVYEALLWIVSMAAGAMTKEAFTPVILAEVLGFNAATFAGLLAVRALKPHTGRFAHSLRAVGSGRHA